LNEGGSLRCGVVWLGNAAAVWSRCWGGVTRRSDETGLSRTTIYKHAQRVEHAVENEAASGVDYETLWDDNQRLRGENQALWEAWAEAEGVPEAKQREFAATGSAMGLSLGQIVTLLAIVLSCQCAPSRATVGRWVSETSRQAGSLLKVLDALCQRWILVLCLDEIFLHGVPVLMAVEPHSMVWAAGQRGPDRSGESWCEVLRSWPCVERVVADAGSGLERGVKLANEERQAGVETPREGAVMGIAMGLDVFHTQRELQRLVQRQWKQAEKQLEAASEADEKVAKSKRRGCDARGVSKQAWWAWRKAERQFDQAVEAETAANGINQTLGLFDQQGQLHHREEAQGQLRQAIQELSGKEWSKVRRLLQDQRTLTHLDWVHAQLSQAVADVALREAVVHVWYLRDAMTQAHGQQRVRLAQVVVIEQAVCQRLYPEWQSAYACVDDILSRVVRASSAVECVNSIVRMHQARHRHVSQSLLDLKRLYWNCRSFRHGKRKGTCPYALLGLELPTYDWWQLLQRGPEELMQNLSTQELAA